MHFNLFLQIYIYGLSIIKNDFPGPTDHYWVKLIEDVHEHLSDKIPDTEAMYKDRHRIYLHLVSLVNVRFLLWDSYNNRLKLNRNRADIRWKFTDEQMEIGDILFGLISRLPEQNS